MLLHLNNILTYADSAAAFKQHISIVLWCLNNVLAYTDGAAGLQLSKNYECLRNRRDLSPLTTILPTILSGDSFYAFALPSCYISIVWVTQTQPHKRSHITASALIRFINVMQPH